MAFRAETVADHGQDALRHGIDGVRIDPRAAADDQRLDIFGVDVGPHGPRAFCNGRCGRRPSG